MLRIQTRTEVEVPCFIVTETWMRGAAQRLRDRDQLLTEDDLRASLWVGKQLIYANMPTKYQIMQPKGKLIPMDSTYPEGLLGVPSQS
jgi:hypothetical protein